MKFCFRNSSLSFVLPCFTQRADPSLRVTYLKICSSYSEGQGLKTEEREPVKLAGHCMLIILQ